jgi:hypothetical protein
MRTEKPYGVLDYKSTKEAVDCFGQQITKYSCARKTNRWPMRLFYFITDSVGYNAFEQRRVVLLELKEQLVTSLMKQRATNHNIGRRTSIARAMLSFGIEPNETAKSPSSAEKKRGLPMQ